MQGILLRVGCDQTKAGGFWNAPVNPISWQYAYVPIPGDEADQNHLSPCPTYARFEQSVRSLNERLPHNLSSQVKVHLDPDFESLTYGEPFKKKKNGKLSSRGQIINRLCLGDFIAFYAAFRPTPDSYEYPLAYCLFGIFHIRQKNLVKELPKKQRIQCAHGRRLNADDDLVVSATPINSGRFERAIPIGEYRSRAYRVNQDLLTAWGGLDVNDGYIQRSARPPSFNNPEKFLNWLSQRNEYSHLLQQIRGKIKINHQCQSNYGWQDHFAPLHFGDTTDPRRCCLLLKWFVQN